MEHFYLRKNVGNHAYNPIANVVPNDISSWNVNTYLSINKSYKLGDFYFYRYIYTFGADGTTHPPF